MTAAPSSRKGLWLAMAGLVSVPMLAVVLVVSLTDDAPPKRRTGLGSTATREPPAIAANTLDPGAERFVEPPAREQPAPAGQARMGVDRAGTAASREPGALAADAAASPGDANARLAESRRLENTDPQRARELLREVLRDDPDNVTALERLSTKLLIDENHAEAKRLAERCRGLEQNPGCNQVSSLAVENSPDVEKLAGAVKNCLVETPGNVNCLAGMVNYHLINGRLSDAAVYAGRLTQAAPQATETLFARGRIKAAGGEYEEARQLFDWACQQGDPQACFRHDTLKSEGW
jgi:tetratricopeptide (TPR) repeat protein